MPKEQAIEIYNSLKDCEWKDGLSHDEDYKQSVKRNQELRQKDCTEAARAIAQINRTLVKQKQFQQFALPFKKVTPRFNRCTEGGHYGQHADAAIMNVPPTRSDLSMTIFLTPTEDYEGGELEIENDDGTLLTFKEEPGTAILYPSYYVHQVKPVTKGARISCILWIQSMIRDEGKRMLLSRMLKLGEQIQQEHKYGHMTTEFSSIYNNLLRMWVENG